MNAMQLGHMNGGDGEMSYANNSKLQGKAAIKTKHIREEAIRNLYSSNTLLTSIGIADLGCSSGPNTLTVVSETIMVVEKLCHQLKCSSPEYKIFLNDLSENDFNSIFKSLDNFKEKLFGEIKTEMGPCYFYGVPGSFYGRLFPNHSLHFVHSSSSLHWLSKAPDDIYNNKRNIYIHKTSPSNVVKAYYEQFQRDISFFLKCRGEEVVEGGRMLLTIYGRRSDDPYSNECCYVWKLLATALNDMVSEGIIKEEKVNSFNIPFYMPSPGEVIQEVHNEGSFASNHMEVFEVGSNDFDESKRDFEIESEIAQSLDNGGYNVEKLVRAVVEPLLISHFGETIIEEVFSRYEKILIDSKENIKFIFVAISLSKKA